MLGGCQLLLLVMTILIIIKGRQEIKRFQKGIRKNKDMGDTTLEGLRFWKEIGIIL